MAEKKKAAKMENHSAEIVTQLLKKGKKNGGTLTYGDLMEALQTRQPTRMTRYLLIFPQVIMRPPLKIDL